jgi:hypothetical protein
MIVEMLLFTRLRRNAVFLVNTKESMDTTSEQIGELIYQPNPDYPYPLAVEKPPHFWMTEQTGRLAAAIDLYLNGDKLLTPEVTLIKQYLRQYLERALLTGDAPRAKLLQRIDTLKTTREISDFADEIAMFGVEVF